MDIFFVVAAIRQQKKNEMLTLTRPVDYRETAKTLELFTEPLVCTAEVQVLLR